MKKVFRKLISVALTAGMVCSFSACSLELPNLNGPDKGTAENFTILSEENIPSTVSETFPNKEAAAKQFAEGELSGTAAEISFVSYEKTADLTAEELAGFGSYTAGEKGYVTYTSAIPGEATALAATEDGQERHSVVLLADGDGYHYCVTPPQVGESVPREYFKSVTMLRDLLNVTAVSTSAVSLAPGMEMTRTLHTWCADTSMYAHNSLKTVIPGYDEGSQESLGKMYDEVYVVENNGKVEAYLKSDGTWIAGNLGKIASLKEYMETSMDLALEKNNPFLDGSYYVRTENGISLDEKKKDKFLQEYLNNDGLSTLKEIYAQYKASGGQMLMQIDVRSDYLYKDGKLSEAISEVTMTIPQPAGEPMVMYSRSRETYTDHGTTTVTLPDDLKAFLVSQG